MLDVTVSSHFTHWTFKWSLMKQSAIFDGRLMLVEDSRWQSYLFSDQLYPAPHWKRKPSDSWRQQMWALFSICVIGKTFQSLCGLVGLNVCAHTQPLVALDPDGGRRDEAVRRLRGGCFRDFCQVLFTLLFHWFLWVLIIVVLISVLCGEQQDRLSGREKGSSLWLRERNGNFRSNCFALNNKIRLTLRFHLF